MDAISTLIRMARLDGVVDVRCLLTGSHVLDNPPTSGRVPFHLLLDGYCTAEIDGHTIDLRPGDVLVLPRGGEHRVRVTTEAPAVPADLRQGASVATLASSSADASTIDLFCGHYTYQPGAGELLIAGLPDILHASFGTGPDSPLRLLGELMRSEAGLDGPGAGALLASLCEALLALVLRGDGTGHPATTTLPTPWTAVAVTDPGLRAVIDAVVHRPREPWTIAVLAHLAGVSRATLVRHFSAATGMGVADFLTRIRMTIAADLLTTTDRSLDAVAEAVGYQSTSAFGKAFRTATGTTPSRLRRAVR
ncbi:transcriptional regulator, AraC family [Catenulispora acidiphila DSM 44928]|uniref:Transcriptional regulator, AraC family n=1 Tax=Catenulispora acidiphila (strain DSM 44928 / JCM 14897 / NBRC 102108 / NRRL B-24433 / ID139908) TaxID=479433 RepID=C7PXM7_CATAD|nr:AraC family transcriptional regulator [Catenulispora acidiphila]ACU71480.1 transcriptional regulator, AraC family [Catenulispora acidiphila DSM 44928]